MPPRNGAPAHLADAQAAAVAAEIRAQLVELDHAVHDRVHVQALFGDLAFVEQQHGRAAAGEVLLQRQHLAAEAQRSSRPAGAISASESNTTRLRLQALDFLQDAAGGFGQFHFGRVEHRVLRLRIELVAEREQFVDVDAVQRPAVGGGDFAQLLLGFRQGHVQHASRRARRLRSRNCSAIVVLPEPGTPSSRYRRCGGQAAVEDDVQPGHAGADRRDGICVHG